MELMERNERIASFTEENDLKAELEKVNRDIEDEMDAMGEAFEHGNYTKVCLVLVFFIFFSGQRSYNIVDLSLFGEK